MEQVLDVLVGDVQEDVSEEEQEVAEDRLHEAFLSQLVPVVRQELVHVGCHQRDKVCQVALKEETFAKFINGELDLIPHDLDGERAKLAYFPVHSTPLSSVFFLGELLEYVLVHIEFYLGK